MPVRQVVCIGLTTADLTYQVDRPLQLDVKSVASGFSLDAGGPAANAARTAALLGSHVMLHSVIGQGPFADFAREVLVGDGVQFRDHCRDDRPWQLPVSAAIVDQLGNRTVVSVNATGAPTPREPDAEPGGEWLDIGGPGPTVGSGAVVLVDGHHLDLALSVLGGGTGSRIVVLDGGSWKPGLERLLPLVDVAVVSQDFAAPPQFRELLAAVPVLATTHGPDPIEVMARSGQSARIPIECVTAVDTLGAGDVLHGGLAHFLTRAGLDDDSPGSTVPWGPAPPDGGSGLDFDTVVSAMEQAARIATRSCQQPGATGWAR